VLQLTIACWKTAFFILFFRLATSNFIGMKKVSRIVIKVYPYIRNKYIFTSLLFIGWMLFFDQNKVISQVEIRMKLSQLRTDKEFYVKEIVKSREEFKLLQNDRELLEKFAREKYLMKKRNEEIFVFSVEKRD